MNILSSPLNPQVGIEVHLTSAKSLRSRVKRNFQARFCRGAWGGDSPFDLSGIVAEAIVSIAEFFQNISLIFLVANFSVNI